MAKITFIVKYIMILLLLFTILPIITTSTDPTVQEKNYEEYCLTALSYILREEQSKKLPFKNFEEFMNHSIRLDTRDPIGLLSFVQDRKDDRVYALAAYYVYENLDVVFYYTMDEDDQKGEFFGCALLSDDSPSEIGWGNVIATERRQEIEKLVVDDITFNRVDNIFNCSNPEGSLNWDAHTTFLVLYDSNSSIAKGWDAFISWVVTNSYLEKEISMNILKNKTTRIETPVKFKERQAELKERQAELDEIIRNSQMIIAILVAMMIIYLLIERRREIDKWRA